MEMQTSTPQNGERPMQAVRRADSHVLEHASDGVTVNVQHLLSGSLGLGGGAVMVLGVFVNTWWTIACGVSALAAAAWIWTTPRSIP